MVSLLWQSTRRHSRQKLAETDAVWAERPARRPRRIRVPARGTEAVCLAAQLFIKGLALDPVYSSKGMAGLIGLAREGRFAGGGSVLWIHTGGGPGIFAYPETMARSAKQPLPTSKAYR
jgi:hypothetical protein